MRQQKKEIKDKNIIQDLLARAAVGRLGTNGADGYPRVKPLNFVYAGSAIYFHSAKEGEKIDDIRRDNRVCFEADLPIAFVNGLPENPCKAEYLYRSVIVYGRAVPVHDEMERRKALSELMRKYQPEGGYGDFLEAKLAITAVIRIDIETMTGKEDLGKEELRERVEAALKAGASLPLDAWRS
jgi:nitroimidazol reductase NimA-like FMN-containing flavoprotein (pyridoxamine 5'-phosphate oxidase superfamily)